MNKFDPSNPTATPISVVADMLAADVHQLAQPDGRMVGTAGHARARAYLIERLEQVGCTPDGDGFAHPYSVAGHSLCNVLGVAPSEHGGESPIVLAAHYDTCGPLPGADDNAAAIAIALRVAERLIDSPAERDVIVALFDGEEPPHYLSPAMGSIHWYRHQRRGPVHCAIVLDLVGHDTPVSGRENLLFVTGMESDPGLVWPDFGHPDLRLQPVLNRYVGDLSDHHVFRADHRPYLFFSCGRWAHYHRPTDTPDRLNYAKMAAITELVEGAVRRAAALELRGPFEAGDTLVIETAAVGRHFGHAPSNRAVMDLFVEMAMAGFGL